MIAAANSEPTNPPIAPATVLLGLTRGMSLRLPKAMPKKSAKPSLATERPNIIQTYNRQWGRPLVMTMHMAMMGSAG